MEPRIDRDLRIPALDGYKLAATLYEPAAGGDALVLINSATAVLRDYYDAFARHLAGEGFTVLTYDYRGIGGSRPRSLRGFRARMRDWGQLDLAGVLEWIGGHLRPRRLLAVGHSVGGQLVGLAEGNWRVHALLTVAAQSAWWGLWPRPGRYRMILTWYLIPVLSRLYGYLPGSFGTKQDLPDGVAREWARWARRPQYLMEDAFRPGFERFRGPLLAYSFSDDDYAPRAAVEGLLDFYTDADIRHRHVRPAEIGAQSIGHFGFFRQAFKETLWRDAIDWLARQAARDLPQPAEPAAIGTATSHISPGRSPVPRPASLFLWRHDPERAG
jgi:predicted alpha/beta hydrolase